MAETQERTSNEKRTGGFDPGATLAGLIFITLGVLFMLDALDVSSIQRELVWPSILIALGLAVVLSAIWNTRGRD